MAYCINCGAEIVSNAKFCQKCGTPVSSNEDNYAKRIQEFSGKVYKCPNCGETLKSFEASCPSCGFELRGAKATSSVREFALKLEAIEARREYEKPRGLSAHATALVQISKTGEQKISLIKNFSIPNTKEDILEFMILATSNIDTTLYGSIDTPTAEAKALSQAWNAKIQQAYAKAKNSYGNELDFSRIQELYDSCYSEIKRQKKKKTWKYVLMFAWIPLMFLILIPSIIISENKDNEAEEARLESLVIEIETAIDAENYRTALMNAELMEYNGFKNEREQYWDVRQKYYIEEILEDAEKHGIKLNYTPPIEEIQSADTKDSSDESVQTFQDEQEPEPDVTRESIEQVGDNLETSNLDESATDIDESKDASPPEIENDTADAPEIYETAKI